MNEYPDFGSMGLSARTLEAISRKGFEKPSQIQALAIPHLLENAGDVIAQAQTGTGKTAAFGIPLLEKIDPGGRDVKAIILVPTRELALQVTDELISLDPQHLFSIAAIYGGASINEQLRRLKKGIDIVVGTPGRVLDHLRRQTLDLSALSYLILDEADEMLNMGFVEDIEQIMEAAGEDRQVMLFSATMPQRIIQLSKKYMRDAHIMRVESTYLTTDLTDQIYFEVREADKFDALTRIIDVEPDFYGIVFSRTKVGTDEIAGKLIERGYAAEGLHGDVSQSSREKILRKFKKKQINILVATDVAARGIDVNNLTHVINYSLPQDSESYVHRIGRTGRAGNSGTAITFISPSEFRQFGYMKKAIKAEIKKEQLPTVEDIVSIKRNKIKEDLREIIEGGNFSECHDMADEILGQNDPRTALSALLKLAFRDELSVTHYNEIRTFSVDRRGKSRLFIAVGRLDGYDARKLVSLLKRECALPDSKIDDVKVMDSYSFVTVPFSDAERVIKGLNSIRKGDRPIAEIAKEGDQRDASSGRGPKSRVRQEQKKAAAKPSPSDEQPGDNWYSVFQKRFDENTEEDFSPRKKHKPAPKKSPRSSKGRDGGQAPLKKESRRQARERKTRR